MALTRSNLYSIQSVFPTAGHTGAAIEKFREAQRSGAKFGVRAYASDAAKLQKTPTPTAAAAEAAKAAEAAETAAAARAAEAAQPAQPARAALGPLVARARAWAAQEALAAQTVEAANAASVAQAANVEGSAPTLKRFLLHEDRSEGKNCHLSLPNRSLRFARCVTKLCVQTSSSVSSPYPVARCPVLVDRFLRTILLLRAGVTRFQNSRKS